MVHANDYGGNMDDYGNDRSWFIHQRATHITEAQMQTMAQEYSAQIDDLSQQNIALTNDNRGMAAERELHMARIAELERQLAARAPQGSARERFEAWARAEGWTYFERLPSGNYEESYLESYWDVWQAARASTNKEGGND